jgi:hypothetical protein
MPLNSSGPLSLGGAVTGQSINLELGNAATAVASINSTPFRTLAGVPSGAISIFNFYGKSNAAYFLAYTGSISAEVSGAITDSSGNYIAFFESSGTYSFTISAGGTFVRSFFYGQRISTPNISGTTVYYAWRNGSVTPGQIGATSFTSTTGTVIASGAAAKSGGTSTIVAYSVAADSSGNMFVGGYINAFGANNHVVMAFNSSGTFLGQTIPYSTSTSYLLGTGTDSSGNVYTCQGTATSGNFYVVKMSHSAGSFTAIWTSLAPGLQNTSAAAYWSWLTVRGSFVYVVGSFSGVQGVLYKLNTSNGSLVWGKQITTTGFCQMTSVSVDQNENVYAFGHGRVDGGAYRRGFVVKFNSAGTEQFRRQMYNSASSDMYQAKSTVDDNNNINFALTNFSAHYMGKFPTDGSKTGTYSIGGTSFTYGTIAGGFSVGNDSRMAVDSNNQGSFTNNNSSTSVSGSASGVTPTILLT